MKPLLTLLLATPVLSLANSPMDGTWVADMGSAKLPDKPDVYVLSQGWYECKSCIPSYRVKADGTDQSVTGHPYYDTLAIEVSDAHTVKMTAKKAGKLSFQDTDAVSADGNSLADSFDDRTEATPVKGTALATRVAAGPAGSHALSGSWRTTKIQNMSQNGITTTVKTTATGVSLRDGSGGGYDAQFDGKDYPMIGDLEHTLVSVKRINANTLEETDKRDGKVVAVVRVTVASDGKTANFVAKNMRQGTTTRVVLHKQE